MPHSLHYQAAKLAMGKLNADEIKATIRDLVDGGFYVDAFLDALDNSRPRLDELLPGEIGEIGVRLQLRGNWGQTPINGSDKFETRNY